MANTEMPGLDLVAAIHRLATKLEKCPMKQASRCVHPDLAAKVKVEVDKFGKCWLHTHLAGQHSPN